jgi:hypothetical protein
MTSGLSGSYCPLGSARHLGGQRIDLLMEELGSEGPVTGSGGIWVVIGTTHR